MIKQLLGFLMGLLSWPLILLGGVLCILNLVLFAGGFPGYRISLYINGAILALVGYLFRIIGERFRRIRY